MCAFSTRNDVMSTIKVGAKKVFSRVVTGRAIQVDGAGRKGQTLGELGSGPHKHSLRFWNVPLFVSALQALTVQSRDG